MKVCVFGAGAIGGHLAGRLAQGGAQVSVVARGSYLAAIREKGLTVSSPEGSFHTRLAATDDPAELGPQDAVVVTVKGQGLPGFAAAVAPLLGPETSVTFVMNGIPWWYFDHHGGPLEGTALPALDPGGAVRRAVGVERTIGGVVHSACTVTEPGVVHVETPGSRVILGEPDGRISDRAKALAAAMETGGLAAPVVPDIRRAVWLKLVSNMTFGPLCLLSRQGIGPTLQDPAIREAARRCLEEGLAVARGLGLEAELDAAKRIAAASSVAHKPSILQDMEAGKPLELEAMAIQPLALARMAGVSTPMLDLTVALARKAAEATGQYVPPT